MSSLISGYFYDIFISYRQKDNRSDQWVTQFVQALKEELDATFKEDISVYFDENPHDGLHDTHDVDDSLKEKVKCLIFIPIVSRTYCDPKSFAWQKEFLPFLDFAKNDEHGLKVKLANGNVTSRVMPIRIHDLYTEDVKLFEKETGSVIRSIDFVYKEAEVNRPLRVNDDDKQYRNQVNKIANATQEILFSIKQGSKRPEDIKTERNDYSTDYSKSTKRKNGIYWIIALAFMAILLSYFRPWKALDSSSKINLTNKSIAVLAFRDLSAAQDLEYLGDGIAEEIIDDLTKLVGLKVIGRTSSFSYKEKNADLISIGEELGVQYILEGSVRKDDLTLRITAQLIDSEDGSHVWSYTQDQELMNNTFALQDQIASEIAELFNETRNQSRMTEVTPEVQNLYLMARYYGDSYRSMSKENFLLSNEYYKKAIALDPSFSKAYSGLAILNGTAGYFGFEFIDNAWEVVRENAEMSIKLDSENPEGLAALAYMKRTLEWDWEMARKLYQRALSIDPNNSQLNYYYGLLLASLNQVDSGLYYTEKAYGLDPLKPEIELGLIRMYNFSRNYDKGISFIINNGKDDYISKTFLAEFLFLSNQEKQYINVLKSMEFDIAPPFEVYEKLGIKAFHREWHKQKGDMIMSGYFESTFQPLTESFSLLKKAVNEKKGWTVYLLVDPGFDHLRNDPRFDDLLIKMGLDVYK
ncbi:MAG: tetratricopeptide repeat protein [Cyclobacteriaceae bacterium]|nr:tetratricopeptide repeat protein [Cyclobacteriaceae bacterium]